MMSKLVIVRQIAGIVRNKREEIMISINSLTVAYGNFTLLDDINFHISEQDKIGLVGKNGAGKSTILKFRHRHPARLQCLRT